MAPLKPKSKVKPFYHVAVGAIVSDDSKVLIAKRAAHKLQGDRWEFPGGKCETGEDALTGLARELDEELGIQPQQSRPLIQIPYDYAEFEVLLDVYLVEAFSGTPHAREKQAFQWVEKSELDSFEFPDANVPIVRAVQLPRVYVFSQSREGNRADAQNDDCIVRLRQQPYSEPYTQNANIMLDLPYYDELLPVKGLHLTSTELYQFEQRPISNNRLLAASLHTAEDIIQANKLQCDFGVLSPVKPTQTHAEATPMGWGKFAERIQTAHFPVYALGGMTPDDLKTAWSHGAQGIAGISFSGR